jgi:hypothetical protein
MQKHSLFLASLLCLSGCGGVSGSYRVLPLDQDITLKVGEHARIANDERTDLELITVKNDSRCPINADCVVAGTAFADMALRDAPVSFPTTTEARPDESLTLELSKTTPTNSSPRPRYQVTFVNLTPSVFAGQTISQSDYRVVLRIHKITQ